jgi:flagellar biosynthesis chaperone FliJ
LKVYDEIIKERREKIIKLENQMNDNDEELFNMYKELEYFEEKRRLDQ